MGMLTDLERRSLEESAYYMRDRGLLGKDVPAPASWTQEQIDAFERIISTEQGRDALLAAALRGFGNVFGGHT